MWIFRPIEIRKSLSGLFALGALCWVGLLVGGAVGHLVAGLGSLVVLAVATTELVLRRREHRRS